MSLWIFLVVGMLLFSIGYYLGNQLGRTAHIRDDLRKARQSSPLEY